MGCGASSEKVRVDMPAANVHSQVDVRLMSESLQELRNHNEVLNRGWTAMLTERKRGLNASNKIEAMAHAQPLIYSMKLVLIELHHMDVAVAENIIVALSLTEEQKAREKKRGIGVLLESLQQNGADVLLRLQADELAENALANAFVPAVLVCRARMSQNLAIKLAPIIEVFWNRARCFANPDLLLTKLSSWAETATDHAVSKVSGCLRSILLKQLNKIGSPHLRTGAQEAIELINLTRVELQMIFNKRLEKVLTEKLGSAVEDVADQLLEGVQQRFNHVLVTLLVDRLHMDRGAAEDVVEMLEPTTEQQGRVQEDGIGVLLEILEEKGAEVLLRLCRRKLGGEVKDALANAFVNAVLVERARMSQELATKVADVIKIFWNQTLSDSRTMVDCFANPDLLLSKLKFWAETTTDDAVSKVSGCLQSVLLGQLSKIRLLGSKEVSSDTGRGLVPINSGLGDEKRSLPAGTLPPLELGPLQAVQKPTVTSDLKESAKNAIEMINLTRTELQTIFNGQLEKLVREKLNSVGVDAIGQLLQGVHQRLSYLLVGLLVNRLRMDHSVAQDVVKRLEPTPEQQGRLREDGIGVLLEVLKEKGANVLPQLADEVKNGLANAFVNAVLVEKMNLSQVVATKVGAAVMLNTDDVLKCIQDPSGILPLLLVWLESAQDVVIHEIGVVVKAELNEKAGKIKMKALREVGQGAVASFVLTKEHLTLIISGDVVELLNTILSEVKGQVSTARARMFSLRNVTAVFH
jgi:hypothetical protein